MFFPHPRTVFLALALAWAGACSSVDYAPAGTTEMGDVGEDEATGGNDTGDDGAGSTDTAPDTDMGEDAGCDPWKQDCPDGEKCTYHHDEYGTVTQCMPVDPEAKGAGETCEVQMGADSGVDDCDAGLVCKYLDEQGFGICVELCGGSMEDPTCSDPDAMCQLCHDDCASVCVPTCNPLAPECAQGHVCAPTNEGVFLCTPSGSKNDAPGMFGDGCTYANECAEGFACVAGETVPKCEDAYCCSPYCDLGGDDVCPLEAVCVPWSDEEDVLPEYEHVGVCSLP